MELRNYEYKSDFARKYVALGRAEGEALGEARGRAEGRRAALLALATARGLTLTAAERDCLDRCTDVATLDGWLVRAATATSAAEVFGE